MSGRRQKTIALGIQSSAFDLTLFNLAHQFRELECGALASDSEPKNECGEAESQQQTVGGILCLGFPHEKVDFHKTNF